MQANQEADGFCQEVPHTTGVILTHALAHARNSMSSNLCRPQGVESWAFSASVLQPPCCMIAVLLGHVSYLI